MKDNFKRLEQDIQESIRNVFGKNIRNFDQQGEAKELTCHWAISETSDGAPVRQISILEGQSYAQVMLALWQIKEEVRADFESYKIVFVPMFNNPKPQQFT